MAVQCPNAHEQRSMRGAQGEKTTQIFVENMAFSSRNQTQSPMYPRKRLYPWITSQPSFCYYFETGSLSVFRLALKSICRPGRSWTCDPPGSASRVIGKDRRPPPQSLVSLRSLKQNLHGVVSFHWRNWVSRTTPDPISRRRCGMWIQVYELTPRRILKVGHERCGEIRSGVGFAFCIRR